MNNLKRLAGKFSCLPLVFLCVVLTLVFGYVTPGLEFFIWSSLEQSSSCQTQKRKEDTKAEKTHVSRELLPGLG